MNTLFSSRRRSGILAHISSLPSAYGIGDIGTASYHFLDFLEESGQSCWQFLPTNPTNSLFDNSPYMSTSAFAGSPLLISPDLLYQDGLIERKSLEQHNDFSPYTTDYDAVQRFKSQLLNEAYHNFSSSTTRDFQEFHKSHIWLSDYALFMALKDHYANSGWFDWPKEIAHREPKAIISALDTHADSMNYYLFEQYIFHNQWSRLRKRANKQHVLLFGDIPIYVGLDSADVWANQDIFTLDPATGLPTLVSGVPPDYFSETGQRWGNPLYRWDSESQEVRQQLEDWWVQRFSAVFELVDLARIDHFRGFESYWAIPAANETAIEGEWLKGPGTNFFLNMRKRLGELEIVAEDLGIITEAVNTLRDTLGFPGMKVLQFAFDGNPKNSFLPHNFSTPNCVVYTGTHDNDTSVGWFLGHQVDDSLRSRVKRIANRRLHDEKSIHEDLIYLAMSSTSLLSIYPLQDVLGFGNDCKMNSPGVATGNWRWRCAPEFLTTELRNHLKSQTELFGRLQVKTESNRQTTPLTDTL